MYWASQVALVVKNLLVNAGHIRDVGLIPGSGRSPGGSMATHSSIPTWIIHMDRGAWWATVHSISKGQTRLKGLAYICIILLWLLWLIGSESHSLQQHWISILASMSQPEIISLDDALLIFFHLKSHVF